MVPYDEPLRQTVLAAELVECSEIEPANAATRAVETLIAGPLLDDALFSIVQLRAHADARVAAAVENRLSQWRQSDPAAARNWQPGS